MKRFESWVPRYHVMNKNWSFIFFYSRLLRPCWNSFVQRDTKTACLSFSPIRLSACWCHFYLLHCLLMSVQAAHDKAKDSPQPYKEHSQLRLSHGCYLFWHHRIVSMDLHCCCTAFLDLCRWGTRLWRCAGFLQLYGSCHGSSWWPKASEVHPCQCVNSVPITDSACLICLKIV